MDQAWIAGKPAALDKALAEAARLLKESRHPLIAGLGTDVAGARAVVALAERTGAAIDHMNAGALFRDLDVMRSSGVMQTTPHEAEVRADTLLLAGPGLATAWPELPRRLLGKTRRGFWLCPGPDVEIIALSEAKIETVGKEPRDLPTLLAALRARLAGRPVGKTRVSSKKLDEVSDGLKSARFGVALWSASTLDTLTIEMICGLVSDLNDTTRFSTLPLSPADNALGVLQTCGWLTGFPMRTGFGRGSPEHDPWLFDADRLVASRETDCVLWISAYRANEPQWRDPPPMIALTAHGAAFRVPPRVHIHVGRPGVDHAAVQHLEATGALAAVAATAPSDIISVAEAITRIASALPESGARRC
jgi:formylmethanofuran dehydrogenase subunit B